MAGDSCGDGFLDVRSRRPGRPRPRCSHRRQCGSVKVVRERKASILPKERSQSVALYLSLFKAACSKCPVARESHYLSELPAQIMGNLLAAGQTLLVARNDP